VSSSARTGTKSEAPFVIANDENENPFVKRKTRRSTHHGEDTDVDELALENQPSKHARRTETVPAKHGAPESRIALSPSRVKQSLSKKTATEMEVASPQTPRHRDSNKVFITPRHRVGIVGKPLTPRSPYTPTIPRQTAPSVYNEARQLFSRNISPGRLIGREKERNELKTFVLPRLESGCSGCTYISGPPGTGKSALVTELYDDLKQQRYTKLGYINCMSVKCSKDIYAKLFEDFVESTHVLEGTEIETLKELFTVGDASYLVTLDEIDYLLDVDITLLYNLFEWALDPSTSLVLVGIANALDLTDRFLPRLKTRGLKPQLLPFMPYSAPQIASVLTAKLKSLILQPSTVVTAEYVPFLHPTAIMFLSKKVAAQSGDLRKAFSLALRTLDAIEGETRTLLSKTTNEPTPSPSPSKTPLLENINLSSPPASRSPRKSQSAPPTKRHIPNPLSHLTIETAPRATIAHVAKVTSSIFGNGATQRLKALNHQQKAVLCALSSIEAKCRATTSSVSVTPSRKANAAPTVKALYEAYTALCKRDRLIHPLTSTEYRDIVASLETQSLVSVVEGKSGTFTPAATPSKRSRGGKASGLGGFAAEERRLASCVGIVELRQALNGAGSEILLDLLKDE